ncbi:MAG: VOC family protein [Candidatus Delongbacteria bacterium]|nr:VOC family protein [Candidatus Delongbacteria bacterium]
MKYVHTNIISKDWKRLSDFYIKVFECKPVPPERDLFGDWLEKGTGVKNAALKGMHLLLPGCGKDGPTLEIFQYSENLNKALPAAANREGFGHIAFKVEDVNKTLSEMIENGGKKLGEVVSKEFKAGTLVFTYAMDPEDNLIEIQSWIPK